MRTASAVSATAALLLAACSGDTESRVVAPSSTLLARAAALAIVSGDNQEAKAGEQLRQPLVVRVTDARGRGVEGTPVSFEITGPGALNGKEAAITRLTMGTRPDGTADVIVEPYDVGRISVAARAEGTRLAPVTFTADAAVLVVQFRPPSAAGVYAAFYGPCRCSRTINTVTVPIGIPVEWVTPDETSYTITSLSNPAGGAAFDSGTLGRGTRFRFVPTVTGTWEYEDRLSGLRATLAAR